MDLADWCPAPTWEWRSGISGPSLCQKVLDATCLKHAFPWTKKPHKKSHQLINFLIACEHPGSTWLSYLDSTAFMWWSTILQGTPKRVWRCLKCQDVPTQMLAELLTGDRHPQFSCTSDRNQFLIFDSLQVQMQRDARRVGKLPRIYFEVCQTEKAGAKTVLWCWEYQQGRTAKHNATSTQHSPYQCRMEVVNRFHDMKNYAAGKTCHSKLPQLVQTARQSILPLSSTANPAIWESWIESNTNGPVLQPDQTCKPCAVILSQIQHDSNTLPYFFPIARASPAANSDSPVMATGSSCWALSYDYLTNFQSSYEFLESVAVLQI